MRCVAACGAWRAITERCLESDHSVAEERSQTDIEFLCMCDSKMYTPTSVRVQEYYYYYYYYYYY